MPGPVSDSYDPEWGTGENKREIEEAVAGMHAKMSKVLKGAKPHYILDLVRMDLPKKIAVTLTEKQWRLLRFACERAGDSL